MSRTAVVAGVSRRRDRLLELLPAFLGLLVFVAALEVLRVEARTISWTTLMADVAGVPRARLALAVALTFANYAALSGYDLLAFAYVGRRPGVMRVVIS